jgi:hypothetical protein
MSGHAVELSLITGGAAVRSDERIAMSLEHPLHRIDVPVRALVYVEACSQQTFWFSDKTCKTYDMPHVRVALAPEIRARLYQLTHLLMRFDRDTDKTLAIFIGGECVGRPVLREPLGVLSSFNISANDLAEAEALAAKLRAGFVRTELRVVGEAEPS